jgi:ABC-type phosphate/phosphonate transport system substrate-binding protein
LLFSVYPSKEADKKLTPEQKQKLQAYFISIKEVTAMMNNLTDEQLKIKEE